MTTRTTSMLIAGAILITPAISLAADEKAAKAENAQIPFANRGGIDNWTADSDKVIYLEDGHNQWYKAELFTNCIGLQFAERIGFVTEPSGAFNKFSSIRVGDQDCKVATFEKSEKPLTRKERKVKEAEKQ